MSVGLPSILALAAALLSQASPVPDPVRWLLAQTAPRPVAAASTTTVKLKAEIRPGWHLYSIGQPPGGPIATEISLPAGQPFTFARPIAAPKPHVIFDPGFGMPVQLYTDQAEFGLTIKVGAAAPAGSQTLTVEARYQSCNDSLCLPPRTTRSTLLLRISK